MSHQSELIEKDIEAYLAEHEQKELLRFLTCGSVDDGKSTLIGRLLHDSKMIYEDQLQAIHKDSKTVGNAGGELDLSLLVDGLKAEREQGITIDVAYRYFSTSRRKFIIADTPGHEQYTRNMATGASTCDLAVILIDARKGISTQTRRHSFIVSLLGIRHVLVAVNKMDLVGFSAEVFGRIRSDYLAFARKLDLGTVDFIPMSALGGDNVVERGSRAPWYTGPTFMEYLESVPVGGDASGQEFRLPVQYVIRPDQTFRGFAGTVESGSVRVGDNVIALPSRRTSRVKSITLYGNEREEAVAAQAPVISLEDEIDLSRGDMLAKTGSTPRIAQTLDAMLVWMSEAPMVPGKQYYAKHTTRFGNAIIDRLEHAIDINTLERRSVPSLGLNEIGRCRITFSEPVIWDPYTDNRSTGSFIVIDRLTNVTVGAGMLLSPENTASRTETGAVRFERVSPAERAARFGQTPALILISGESVQKRQAVAATLERALFDNGRAAYCFEEAASSVGPGGWRLRLVEQALALTKAGNIAIIPAPEGILPDSEETRSSLGCALLEIRVQSTGSQGTGGHADLLLAASSSLTDETVDKMLALLRERGILVDS